MNVYHSIALKEGRNYPFCQGRRTVWVPHRDTSCLQPAAPVTVTIYTNRAAVAAGMALCEGWGRAGAGLIPGIGVQGSPQHLPLHPMRWAWPLNPVRSLGNGRPEAEGPGGPRRHGWAQLPQPLTGKGTGHTTLSFIPPYLSPAVFHHFSSSLLQSSQLHACAGARWCSTKSLNLYCPWGNKRVCVYMRFCRPA